MMTEKEELEFLREFLLDHFIINPAVLDKNVDQDLNHMRSVLAFAYNQNDMDYSDLKHSMGDDVEFDQKLLSIYMKTALKKGGEEATELIEAATKNNWPISASVEG